MVAPSQGRELKLEGCPGADQYLPAVAPSQGRELKQYPSKIQAWGQKVAPSQGRELKRQVICIPINKSQSPLHRGVN